MGHSVAGVHSNLSPMRYVVGHFLHVFTYILLTRVQLFIDKPRPFAQIEIDAGAHAQIFTTEGIPSGTEALINTKSKTRQLRSQRFPESLSLTSLQTKFWSKKQESILTGNVTVPH